jgi:hypothetical protein
LNDAHLVFIVTEFKAFATEQKVLHCIVAVEIANTFLN